MKTPFVSLYKPYGFLIEMWVVLALMLIVYAIIWYENYKTISKGMDKHVNKKKN